MGSLGSLENLSLLELPYMSCEVGGSVWAATETSCATSCWLVLPFWTKYPELWGFCFAEGDYGYHRLKVLMWILGDTFFFLWTTHVSTEMYYFLFCQTRSWELNTVQSGRRYHWVWSPSSLVVVVAIGYLCHTYPWQKRPLCIVTKCAVRSKAKTWKGEPSSSFQP